MMLRYYEEAAMKSLNDKATTDLTVKMCPIKDEAVKLSNSTILHAP